MCQKGLHVSPLVPKTNYSALMRLFSSAYQLAVLERTGWRHRKGLAILGFLGRHSPHAMVRFIDLHAWMLSVKDQSEE